MWFPVAFILLSQIWKKQNNRLGYCSILCVFWPRATWFDGSVRICTALQFVMWVGPKRIGFICSTKQRSREIKTACHKYVREINAKEGKNQNSLS